MGCPIGFRADAVATAKRDLNPGESLDGEGGYTVYGRLLPLGLAQGVKLLSPIAEGTPVKWSDLAVDADDDVVRFRREMEAVFSPPANSRDSEELSVYTFQKPGDQGIIPSNTLQHNFLAR
jgi:predicted homoserine dehydrogenase-like protein